VLLLLLLLLLLQPEQCGRWKAWHWFIGTTAVRLVKGKAVLLFYNALAGT